MTSCQHTGLLARSSDGLYGVLAYAATLRTREMGVRMALGATRRDVGTLVIGWGMRLTALGVAIGLGLAYLGRSITDGLLYGVAASDPATFAGVGAVFALVALAAGYLPARRAARVDPLVVLKERAGRPPGTLYSARRPRRGVPHRAET